MKSYIEALKKKVIHFLKPVYYLIRDFVNFKNIETLKENINLHNKYENQRCFLILTGASLDHIDLSKLFNENTMALNLLGLHSKIKELNLKMYFHPLSAKKINTSKNYLNAEKIIMDSEAVCLNQYRDKRYLLDFQNIIKNNPERATNIMHLIDSSLANNGIIFLESSNRKYIEKRSLFKNKRTVYYSVKDVFSNTSRKIDDLTLDIDLTRRFHGSDNTMVNAIFILIYLGVKEIYLCGSGYTLDPRYEFHFYDSYLIPKEYGYSKSEEIAKSLGETHNKIHGSNIKFHGLFEKEDHYQAIFVTSADYDSNANKMHQKVNLFAKSKGVNIYNIVPPGFKSTEYEGVDWEILKSKLN